MFAIALREVEKYTYPVIVSTRYFSGEVEAGCAAFVVLNRDGWIITASHVMEGILVRQQHQKEIAQYEAAKAGIENERSLSSKQKKRELAKLRPNPKWITHLSHWWGRDGVIAHQVSGDKITDIAIGRLDPFDPDSIRIYPTFWNPQDELLPGKSLCRLGFPFHEIKATFEEATGRFTLAPGSVPVPRFPLDGILTRMAILIEEATGRKAEFIEVSTPGLRGQSGGPIFDTSARICGIQSRTHHMPLGFNPKLREGNREVVEHQFLNVGMGAHVKEVIPFLQQRNIIVNIALRRDSEGT